MRIVARLRAWLAQWRCRKNVAVTGYEVIYDGATTVHIEFHCGPDLALGTGADIPAKLITDDRRR